MAALDGEAGLAPPFHADARQGARAFSLKGFYDILGARMLHLAIDATESTADANVLSDVDLLHSALIR
jgi:hypothetical protein